MAAAKVLAASDRCEHEPDAQVRADTPSRV
jgi:hypothetical protein